MADKQLNALLELERRIKTEDSSVAALTQEQRQKVAQRLSVYRQQGLAKPLEGPDADAPVTTEGERKAAAFLTRALGSNKQYEAQGMGARSLIGQSLSENAPDMLNSLPAFMGNSSQRQVADTTQDEFIAASLRQDSGAVIPPEEMAKQRRIYFPMPGDGPDVIEAKKQARMRAIAGLRTSAGALAKEGEKNAEENTTVIGGNPTVVSAAPTGMVVDPSGSRPTEKRDFANEARIQNTATKLLRDGKDEATILDYLKSEGVPTDGITGLQDAVNLIKSNPAAPVAVDVGGIMGANGDKKTDPTMLGKLAATAPGAYAIGASNALTLGGLDEIVGATGGDAGMAEAAKQASRADSPIAAGLGELSGGMMGAYLGGRVPSLAARPIATNAGLAGAYGFGENNDNRLAGGALAAGIGGGATFLGGKLAQRYANRPAPELPPETPGPTGRDVASAAGDLKIPILPADVGGPLSRRMTAGALQTPFGAGPITKVANATTEAAQGVRDRVAGFAGDVQESYGAGKAAQRGAKSFLKTSDRRADRLYENISVEPTMPAQTSNTITSLEKVTQGLDSNPELSKLWVGNPRLRASLDAIKVPNVRQTTNAVGYPVMEKQAADGSWVKMTQAEIDAGRPKEGGVSWADMKRLRSIVGEIVSSPSHSSDGSEKSAMRALYAGLSEDMRATAQRAGPKALREFERANSYFRARETRVENVIKPILGDDFNKGGQAAFNQIQNWSKAKGESARVAQLLRSVPEDEADTVRGTVIGALGRAADGKQNATGDAFSLDTFLTHWNQIDPRAKSALFTGQQKETLEKLATVAEGVKGRNAYANTSNTAGASNVNATAGSLVAAGGALATGHPVVALALASPAAGQYVTGKMLSSPAVVRWMTKEVAPRAMPAHLKKIGKLAASDPVLANDLSVFVQKLTGANDNVVASVAASDNKQK